MMAGATLGNDQEPSPKKPRECVRATKVTKKMHAIRKLVWDDCTANQAANSNDCARDENVFARGETSRRRMVNMRNALTLQLRVLKVRSRSCCILHASFVFITAVLGPLVLGSMGMVAYVSLRDNRASSTCCNASAASEAATENQNAQMLEATSSLLQAVGFVAVFFLWATEVGNLSATRVHLKTVRSKLDVVMKNLSEDLNNCEPPEAPGEQSADGEEIVHPRAYLSPHRSVSQIKTTPPKINGGGSAEGKVQHSGTVQHSVKQMLATQMLRNPPPLSHQTTASSVESSTKYSKRSIQRILDTEHLLFADVETAIDAAQARLLCCASNYNACYQCAYNPSVCCSCTKPCNTPEDYGILDPEDRNAETSSSTMYRAHKHWENKLNVDALKEELTTPSEEKNDCCGCCGQNVAASRGANKF